jgi:hypothetical protein
MEENKDYLMEKKIEYMIDMKLNALKNQLTQAVEQVNTLVEDVDILKNKVQRLNFSAGPQSKLVVEAKKEKPKDNGRTGNLQPGDVSIEKMFYFGKR